MESRNVNVLVRRIIVDKEEHIRSRDLLLRMSAENDLCKSSQGYTKKINITYYKRTVLKIIMNL